MKKSTDEIYDESILEAQKDAQRNGLVIGATIAHPDDEFAYELIEIRGDVAIGKISAEFSETGKEIIKEFPIKEILDVKKALAFAHIKGAVNNSKKHTGRKY